MGEECDSLPAAGTVEELLRLAADVPREATAFGLWVPAELTWAGEPVTQRAGLAAVVDTLRARGFAPEREVEHPTGRFCVFDRYRV